jgi:hypothetical protein
MLSPGCSVYLFCADQLGFIKNKTGRDKIMSEKTMRVEITMQVSKLVLGKTQWDEKDCGLTTQLNFKCVAHPNEIGRISNLLKQNVPMSVTIVSNQAEWDLSYSKLEKGEPLDLTANASQPPVEDVLKAGSTPIRTGEPIVDGANDPDELPETTDEEINADSTEAERLSQEAEANAEFDAMPSGDGGNGNGHKPKSVIVDLSDLVIKVPEGKREKYSVSLGGCTKRGEELVGTILTVFNSKAVPANTSEQLIDALFEHPQSANRDMLLEVLRVGHMPEAVEAL